MCTYGNDDVIQENMSDASVDVEQLEEVGEEAGVSDLCDLEKQLEHNFASLLLKV